MQYFQLKYYLLIPCIFLIALNANAQQCVNGQTFTISPAGPYEPGDVVEVTYSMNEFDQINSNWLIGIQINLGNGWEGLTSTDFPNNTGQPGNWVWDNQHIFPSGLNFGPGWRFVTFVFNPNYGIDSEGPFSVSFNVTVSETCTADDLSISIESIGDCLTGGWNDGNCCDDPPFVVYNGVVSVNSVPSAGSSNSITICPSRAPINLFDELGGSPEINGTWSPVLSNGYFGSFDPNLNSSNDYTYSLSNECGMSSATINVNFIEPIVVNTINFEICSDDMTQDLFGEIGANNISGEWSGVGPLLNSPPTPDFLGLFNPQQQTPGMYTYTITNASGCETDYPINVAVINSQANAGIDGVIDICFDDSPINLFDYLTGNPNQGGSWSPSLNSYLGVFDPANNFSGNYTYIVQDECGSDDSEVLITVTTVSPPPIILD